MDTIPQGFEDSRAQICSAQTSAHICGALWELEILFSSPQEAGQEERRGKACRIFVFAFGSVSDQKSWGSVWAFVGTRHVPVEKARSRAVCSFRDFKAHSSEDVAITILASSLCLGWPCTLQEESLAGLGPVKMYSLKCNVPENVPFLPVLCAYSPNCDLCSYWMSRMQR